MMLTLVYEHSLTEVHLKSVREVIGYEIIEPVGKGLAYACGDVGESFGPLVISYFP